MNNHELNSTSNKGKGCLSALFGIFFRHVPEQPPKTSPQKMEYGTMTIFRSRQARGKDGQWHETGERETLTLPVEPYHMEDTKKHYDELGKDKK